MEKIKVQKLFHLKNCPPKSHRVRSSSTSSPIKKNKREGRALYRQQKCHRRRRRKKEAAAKVLSGAGLLSLEAQNDPISFKRAAAYSHAVYPP